MKATAQKKKESRHAAVIRDSANFDVVGTQTLPNGVQILLGKPKGKADAKAVPLSYKFPKSKWTPEKARTWLKEKKIGFKKFEVAAVITDAQKKDDEKNGKKPNGKNGKPNGKKKNGKMPPQFQSKKDKNTKAAGKPLDEKKKKITMKRIRQQRDTVSRPLPRFAVELLVDEWDKL